MWAPALNGETGAKYRFSYSESNGEAIGKGFVLNGGFPNTDKWELTFEFQHDNIQYSGICFLADLNGSYNGGGGGSGSYTSWEGDWPGTSNYATYSSGKISYFDVKVTKIDSTHFQISSEKLNRSTIRQWDTLSGITQLTCGARHNDASSYGGPSRIRNVKAIIF